MIHGFLKACTVSPALRVADCAFNTQQTIAAMQRAAADGAQLAVFPELGLTGYTCGDLFFQQPLQRAAAKGLAAVLEASAGLDLVALVRARRDNDDGQKGPFAHGFYYLKPINIGKTEVENDQIRTVRGYHGVRLRAGAGDDNVVVVGRKYCAQKVCYAALVFNNENFVSNVHSSSSSAGNEKPNTAPPSGRFDALILPP